MTKRAAILHGTDGSPTDLKWQMWLKDQLENSGYEVYFPQLPDCHTPDLETYDKFLQNSNWNFEDNLLIGHSSGATTALHLLGQNWFPKIRATALIGTFLNEKLMENASWHEAGQFDKLFVETFEPEKIKPKSDKFYFVHGDDDPYCDYDDARKLCNELGGKFLTLPGGGHIAKSSGISELPILNDQLRHDGLL